MNYVGPNLMLDGFLGSATGLLLTEGMLLMGPLEISSIPGGDDSDLFEEFPMVITDDAFKLIGKFLYIKQLADDLAQSYLQVSMAMVDEAVSGLAEDYPRYREYLVPTISTLETIVSVARATSARATESIKIYLSNRVGPGLGLPRGGSVALAAQALADQMTDEDDSVEADGLFDQLFASLGAELPTSGSPTVPDSWVSGELVA